jgi:hypothetical protein
VVRSRRARVPPDLQLEGVHDLKVLKGIRLEHYNNGGTASR